MNKKESDAAIAMILISAVVIVVTSIASRANRKRIAKREAQEELSRNIAHAHLTEMLDAINEDLDRKIGIAKKALLDDDFNQITKDF